jgi:hypothetical protein
MADESDTREKIRAPDDDLSRWPINTNNTINTQTTEALDGIA